MLVGVLVMVVVFGHGLHCPGDRCECPRGLPPPASYQGSLGDRAIPRAVPLYRGSMTAFGPRVVRFTPLGGLFPGSAAQRANKLVEAKVGFEPTWTALQTVASPHSATSPLRDALCGSRVKRHAR